MSVEEDLDAAWNRMSKESQVLLDKVLKVESDKLYLGKPRGVIDELLEAVDVVVR